MKITFNDKTFLVKVEYTYQGTVEQEVEREIQFECLMSMNAYISGMLYMLDFHGQEQYTIVNDKYELSIYEVENSFPMGF